MSLFTRKKRQKKRKTRWYHANPDDPKQRNKFRNGAWRNSDKHCYYCRVSLTRKTFTIEHKHPRRYGGSNDPSNIAVCCRDCNSVKGGRLLRSHTLIEVGEVEFDFHDGTTKTKNKERNENE